MRIGLLIVIIAFVFIVVVKFRKKNKSEENNFNTIEKNDEMEILFFTELKNGEKKCKLTHILDEFDFAFIKILFQEERIPYYMEEDKTLNIWPQRKLGTHGNINLYILEKNYDEAINLIEKHRKNKS